MCDASLIMHAPWHKETSEDICLSLFCPSTFTWVLGIKVSSVLFLSRYLYPLQLSSNSRLFKTQEQFLPQKPQKAVY